MTSRATAPSISKITQLLPSSTPIHANPPLPRAPLNLIPRTRGDYRGQHLTDNLNRPCAVPAPQQPSTTLLLSAPYYRKTAKLFQKVRLCKYMQMNPDPVGPILLGTALQRGSWARGHAWLLAEPPPGRSARRTPSMTSWTPSTTRTSPPAPPPPSAPLPSGGSPALPLYIGTYITVSIHPSPARRGRIHQQVCELLCRHSGIPCLSFPTCNSDRRSWLESWTLPALAEVWELINVGFS